MNTINSKALAWIAVGISSIALVISFVALSDARDNLNSEVQPVQRVDQAQMRVFENRIELERTRQRLEALRQDITEGTNIEQTQTELADLRQDIRANVADASNQTQDAWQNIDTELEQLEQQVRDQSADAVATLNDLLAQLEEDIRTDEEN